MRDITPEEERLIERIARETTRLLVASPERVSIAGTGVDREDLEMEARVAALRALRSYDPSRGTALTSWLICQARGAVLEGLRQADVLSRVERRRYRQKCRADPGAPIPRSLISFEDLDDPQWDDESGERQPAYSLPRVTDPAIDSTPDRLALDAAFAALSGRVSPGARLVATWHLREGLTLAACAERLKLSHTRAWQFHEEARALLRRSLEGEPLPPPEPKRRDKAWIAPFLHALRRGVTKALACELAGVSRSLPYLHSMRDPDFARAWAEAKAAAGPYQPGRPWTKQFLTLIRLGIRRREACAAVGISYFAPNQAGNRDPAFRASWRAARVAAGSQAPPDWCERFLKAIAGGLTVTAASASAGVHPHTPAGAARRDPEFRRAWDEAKVAAGHRRAA